MKRRIKLTDYISLQTCIERAVREYGPALQRVVISNEARLNILQFDGIDVNSRSIQGVVVITEPVLRKDEVQVVLAPDHKA